MFSNPSQVTLREQTRFSAGARAYSRSYHVARRTTRATRRKSLVLVPRRKFHEQDFAAVARLAERMAPDISAYVMRDRVCNLMRPNVWSRPTLVFCPHRMRQLRPVRGSVFSGWALNKSEECRWLEAAQVPVPRWALVTQDHMPDLTDFDTYVVTKPDFGSRGAEVKIRRKTRVRWKPSKYNRGRRGYNLLIQQFIYTGPWPVCYRVSTFFGEVLYAWRVEADHRHPALSNPTEFAGGTATSGGYSITSSGRGCTITLCNDEQILELGRQAAAAVPEVPLLGIDIVREVPSGKAYVLELNTCGETWHFSSDTGRSIQRDNGIDFRSQFGGMSLVARTLVDRTRRLAA